VNLESSPRPIRPTRHAAVLLLVALLAVLVAACSDSSSASSDSTTTTVASDGAPGTAKITALDVPESVECGGKTSTTVSISYATEGAKKRELYVDGRKEQGTDAASGTVSSLLHCDPLPHTVDLIAYDAHGGKTVLEKKVVTNA
jgi:hypothetical protein